MQVSEMVTFYQQLGNLFYAVAFADKKISENEISTLRNLVTQVWLNFEDSTDEFGSDAAFQIEITFELLIEQNAETYHCFKRFEEFRNSNPTLFSQPVKNLIWKTAESIASENGRKNKSELVILSKLATVLN